MYLSFALLSKENQNLSDLLDAHQDRPTEVKTSRQGKDHHHFLDQSKTTTARPKLVILPVVSKPA